MIDQAIINGTQGVVAELGSSVAPTVAAKVAAADAATKAAATTVIPHTGIVSKMLTTSKAIVLSPLFGGIIALGAVIGLEFWRGKVDEKSMNLPTK
ncbi:hypothetical protein MHK_007702 [Candidatus Magnetomorum sp. HK-1]|nr:hypothetical protein MHK_007702 [Candidatus Magnetomorum sp. HK-1]